MAEDIALFHSELSEALECLRGHAMPHVIWTGSDGKPEGVAVELADVIIRIADCCYERDIPLADAIDAKLRYNETRPYRHGGRAL